MLLRRSLTLARHECVVHTSPSPCPWEGRTTSTCTQPTDLGILITTVDTHAPAEAVPQAPSISLSTSQRQSSKSCPSRALELCGKYRNPQKKDASAFRCKCLLLHLCLDRHIIDVKLFHAARFKREGRGREPAQRRRPGHDATVLTKQPSISILTQLAQQCSAGAATAPAVHAPRAPGSPQAAALTADCRSRRRARWRRHGSGCPGEELCPQFTAAMTSRDAGPRRPAWLPRELLKACGGSGVPRACCRAHAARTTEKTAVVCAHLVNPVGLPKGGPRRSRQGSPAAGRPAPPQKGAGGREPQGRRAAARAMAPARRAARTKC